MARNARQLLASSDSILDRPAATALHFDLGMTFPQPTPPCTPAQAAARAPSRDQNSEAFDHPELLDLAGTFPHATHRPWLADVTVRL
jgi:hypothetical protein